MREGRELARRTKDYAVDQPGRSWFHLISTLLVFVGLVVVTASSALPWLVRLPFSVLLALVHVRFFVIFHDYQHGAILSGSRIAKGIFSLYGLVTLSPSGVWKHSHDGHHQNNSRTRGTDAIGSYPVMSIEEFRAASWRQRLFYRVARHPMTQAFGYLTVFLWGFCISPFLREPRRHLDGLLAILVHGGIIAALAWTRPDAMLLTVIVPSLVASAIGAYLFFAQHNFPGVELRHDDEWDHVFAALHSSSFLRMGPVMNWFTANIGYHHIHHLNHRIPFYRLPEVMAAEEELQSPVETTLRPSDIFRCLRLQLWDPRRRKLVSFREARAEAA